jgi:hypothetical protein
LINNSNSGSKWIAIVEQHAAAGSPLPERLPSQYSFTGNELLSQAYVATNKLSSGILSDMFLFENTIFTKAPFELTSEDSREVIYVKSTTAILKSP